MDMKPLEFRLALTDDKGNVLRMWWSELDFSYPIRKFGKDQLANEINEEIEKNMRKS